MTWCPAPPIGDTTLLHFLCVSLQLESLQLHMSALPVVLHIEVAAMRADVYERLTPRGKKATFTTLLTTQVWLLN